MLTEKKEDVPGGSLALGMELLCVEAEIDDGILESEGLLIRQRSFEDVDCERGSSERDTG